MAFMKFENCNLCDEGYPETAVHQFHHLSLALRDLGHEIWEIVEPLFLDIFEKLEQLRKKFPPKN